MIWITRDMSRKSQVGLLFELVLDLATHRYMYFIASQIQSKQCL
jgi:hypothetical protein